MNILFLVYWGYNDGLTTSTVVPHLKILESNDKVKSIVLVTIERDQVIDERRVSSKTLHIPWNSSPRFLSKIKDFTSLPTRIIGIVGALNIDFMVCRGTPAGAIGYLVHRKTKIPYAVESFEPHADYMRESGVWSRWSLSYLILRYWERKQARTACYLMPVSKEYMNVMQSRGVEKHRLFHMPCAVDYPLFAFKVDNRDAIREQLGITADKVVGIYVGKFGGMYFDDEAFQIFKIAREFFKNFYLIVLTPDDHEKVDSKLENAGYLKDGFHIKYVQHTEVPRYLSAADFAFATYKPGYFKRYLSPVKVGEYWAAGLPILITEGIGDDYVIVNEGGLGAVFKYNRDNLMDAFSRLKDILSKGRIASNARIQPFAVKYRNIHQNARVYNTIIDELG